MLATTSVYNVAWILQDSAECAQHILDASSIFLEVYLACNEGRCYGEIFRRTWTYIRSSEALKFGMKSNRSFDPEDVCASYSEILEK